MKNRYGVGVSYFNNAIKRDLLDLSDYKPDELARIFARLSKTADPDVLKESEFSGVPLEDIKDVLKLAAILIVTRGCYTTTDLHTIGKLDTLLSSMFSLDSGGVTFENIDDLIQSINDL